MRKSGMHRPAEERIFHAVCCAAVLVFSLICLFPFANTFANAFSDNHAIMTGKVSVWPMGFQTDALRFVLQNRSVLGAMRVTVTITVLGTLLNMTMTILTAFAVSHRDLKGRQGFMMFFIITMLFNGGQIPSYLLVKELGLLNTLASVILPVAMSTFNLIVMKTFFESIPADLQEAARIDGCGHTTYLLRILLPLSVPVVATIALFYMVQHWNNYFAPMLYIDDPKLYTLQIKLRQLLLLGQQRELIEGQSDAARAAVMEESLKAAVVVVSTVPILLVYPWLQKYFVQGAMLGAVKG